MFQFRARQLEYEINGVKIGGPPWKNPTVLIGTIFYEGHKVVKDWKEGLIDVLRAEAILKNLEELTDKYGIPGILDVFAGTPQAMKNYIDFLIDHVDFPFLIDSADPQTLIEGSRYVKELGIAHRAIYNSVNYKTTEAEMNECRKLELPNVIVAATNPYNPTVNGRLEILKGSNGEGGLLEKARGMGFKNILIDVSMLDAPDVGPASKAIFLIKDELGIPAGVGSVNYFELWSRGKNVPQKISEICRAGGILFPVPLGADFIMYGPVEWAEDIYALCNIYNSFMGYTLRLEGIQLPGNHPLTRFKT
jgi:tetrahydromethanopterin S-methyltransferase subunit H